MRFSVMVETRLRPGIADPQGHTIERSLPALGFTGIEGMRVGKVFRFTVDADDPAAAEALAVDLTDRLLINPVIEAADVSVAALEVT